MKKISVMLRLAPLLVAGAVALGSASAIAADTQNGPSPIPTDAKGSITVHKHFGDPVSPATPGNGKVNNSISNTTNPPLQGVVFKVEKAANFDLSTNAGWKNAQTFLANPDGGTPAPGFAAQGGNQTTGNDGTAAFTDLPIGLYRVTEVDVSAAKKNGTGSVVTVKKAAPFYVTIPMTNPDKTDEWMYTVHVYPKNQAFTVTKTSMPIANDQMRYTVTATLPSLPAGKHYEKYSLIDIMTANHDLNSFTMESVKARTDSSDSSPIDIGTTNLTVDKTSGAAANKVYSKFNPAGLTQLENASTAGKKEVVYTYTVKLKSTFTKGDLTNRAFVAPSNEYEETTAGDPNDNTPGTSNTKKYVQFQIEKQDATTNAAKLAGAEFELYACNASGQFINAAGTVVANKADAVKLSGASALVTKATTGKTDPIRMPVADATSADAIKNICAVETKAPAGYSLLAQPVNFTLSCAEDACTTTQVKAIDNVQANAGWKLPLTGAQGLVVLSVAGALLIMGSILLVLTSRRKKADK